MTYHQICFSGTGTACPSGSPECTPFYNWLPVYMLITVYLFVVFHLTIVLSVLHLKMCLLINTLVYIIFCEIPFLSHLTKCHLRFLPLLNSVNCLFIVS
jgi:hypothetical protein